MSFVVKEYILRMRKLWRILPDTLHAAQAPALRVRASLSQERMTYLRDESKVLYQSKDGNKTKNFDALEWSCPMKQHIHIPKRLKNHTGNELRTNIYSSYFTG